MEIKTKKDLADALTDFGNELQEAIDFTGDCLRGDAKEFERKLEIGKTVAHAAIDVGSIIKDLAEQIEAAAENESVTLTVQVIKSRDGKLLLATTASSEECAKEWAEINDIKDDIDIEKIKLV